LGIVFAALVTAFSVDPLTAVIVFLCMIALQIIEEYFIFPRIM
jgi:predicted PurR-regulated permease PerM